MRKLVPAGQGQATVGADTAGFRQLFGSRDLVGIDHVVAPLFGLAFDGHDLVKALHARGFRGRVTLTSQVLPNPDMVLQELCAVARPLGIDVHLPAARPVSPPPLAGRAAHARDA